MVARGMGGRAVEGTGLENRQTRKGLVGSNPTPSANPYRPNSPPDHSAPLKSPGNAGFSRQNS